MQYDDEKITGLDASWFRRHPERHYRLRRATRGEIEAVGLPVTPEATTVRAVVRCSDGATVLAVESARRPFKDDDFALKNLFRVLSSVKSQADRG